ncbi:TPA: ABC transporter permease [Stenotrophomonas maltophilia]|uniref:ABC transporter permease n=1 Tax=Stenotrophomonas maltophilia group TaxID=995085 RepID=UPI001312F81B|nr:ABC transporter permease [Stenotrophomonas maltophilia]HEL3813742.1 ABC transporter permease [Stenotrophomonas maltophilia]
MHSYSSTFKDLLDGIRGAKVPLYIAKGDITARYRRSVLGPFWQSLATALGVVGLGLLWSQLLKMDKETFIPTLTAGLIIWQMLSGILIESCGLFVRQASIIRNVVMPLSVHPLSVVIRYLVNFAHSLLVFVIVAIVMKVDVNWNTLLFIPNLALVVVNLLWLSFVFGVAGARYRDLEYGVASIMPMLFLVSPVMYRLEYLPFSSVILEFNPFTYLIEALRAPMLGHVASLQTYAVLAVMAIVGWLLAFWMLHKAKLRLPFWI